MVLVTNYRCARDDLPPGGGKFAVCVDEASGNWEEISVVKLDSLPKNIRDEMKRGNITKLYVQHSPS
jgi:hypothetical protein